MENSHINSQNRAGCTCREEYILAQGLETRKMKSFCIYIVQPPTVLTASGPCVYKCATASDEAKTEYHSGKVQEFAGDKRNYSKSLNPSQNHYNKSNTPPLWWKFRKSEQNWTVMILNQSRFQGCQRKKICSFLSNPCQRMMSGNWSNNH